MKRLTILAFAFLLSTAAAVRADVVIPFAVDTSSVAGADGWVDFQFNPLNSSTLPETAAIEAVTGASYNTTLGASLTGSASGGPIGTADLVLSNASAYNDAFEGVTYGSQLDFVLDLSGPGIGAGGSNSTGQFTFSLFDVNQNPILTTDPNGYALTVNVNADGSVSVIPLSPNVTATPEPGMMGLGLLSLGYLSVAALRRRGVH